MIQNTSKMQLVKVYIGAVNSIVKSTVAAKRLLLSKNGVPQ